MDLDSSLEYLKGAGHRKSFISPRSRNSTGGSITTSSAAMDLHRRSSVVAISEEEVNAFALHINNHLVSNEMVAHLLPIQFSSEDLFGKLKDGLILASLVNLAKPNMIKDEALKKGTQLSVFESKQNLNAVMDAAKALNLHLVNIGIDDIQQGR
jgi:hypothetical protein